MDMNKITVGIISFTAGMAAQHVISVKLQDRSMARWMAEREKQDKMTAWHARKYEAGQFWRIENRLVEHDIELEYTLEDAIAYLQGKVDAGVWSAQFNGITVHTPDGKEYVDLAVQRFIDTEGRI